MTHLLHRTACPVCRSAEIAPVLEASDHTVSGEVFAIWECRNCGLRFTQDVPDAGAIGKYYQSEDYISHSETRKGIINRLYHQVRRRALHQKLGWINRYAQQQPGTLLDIGCGTGAFLQTMQQAGWKATGTEPDEQARENARRLHGVEPLPSAALFHLPPHSFDVITMWHVLEHVHELHEYIAQIRSLLTPEGTVLIALPNYRSLDAQHYASSWAAYDVPRHLYHFSPKALSSLAAQHQLKMVRQIAMPFDSFYISLLSERYLHGKSRLLQGGWTGYRSFLHGRKKTDEASSLVYILKKE